MKKLLVLLAVSVSLFACKSEADKNEKIAQDNIKFYSNVWDVAINQGNISILDEAYAPDVVLHTVPETKGAANAPAAPAIPQPRTPAHA